MELYLNPEFTDEKRNPVTGRFEKGYIPQNKGKKMPKEIRKKVSKTWFKKGCKSIKKHHTGGRQSIPVEMWKDGKLIGVFESIHQAGLKTGILRRNINKVIAGERKKAGGFIWKRADVNYFKN